MAGADGRTPVRDDDVDIDVAIVGGGPTGCAAGVFTARYGLETTIFDRGPSSLQRCASLENYLGFPHGIDVETFLELAHDHADAAGCRIRDALIESVAALEAAESGAGSGDELDDAADNGGENGVGDGRGNGGFRLEPQDGDPITARFVIAATKYDGAYLRGLDDEAALFVTEDHDGKTTERFDRAYPDVDGRTPVDGLYVAGPLAGSGDQAIIAAGHGANAARTLIRDLREDAGFWGRFADHYDWRRTVENRREEWLDPQRWVELLEDTAPDDCDPRTVRRLAETAADERAAAYVDPDVADRRAERGQRRLAAALDDELLLEAVDDEAILERAAALEGTASSPDG